ncbi:MAG TPA: HlyD family efflux transporter periplasmic adaptor subunit [Caldilineae bacterium]|nr:HlyD family efflux transporter periplasmic adaptor subunit [Caldilineae bacterium]
MKRIVIIAVIVIVVALGGWWAYNRFVAQPPEPTATETAAQEAALAELENVIWASGKLTPERWAALSPATGGTVSSLATTEGEWVQAGAVLAELDNRVLHSQVDVAAAAVSEAEAARDKLLAGATKAELDAAKADIAAAEAAVALAQAQLQQAREGVTAAETQVSIAQAQYDELASHPTQTERIAAQKEVDMAKAAVDQAQAAYDIVRGNPHIGALPQSAALHQATLAYEAAQAAYRAVVQGATRQQLAIAQAQIDSAKEQVAVARAQIPAAEAGVQAAEAQLARAQAALDALETGATAEDIAVAEARIESATATLATATAQLQQTQIVAPFDGQVGSIFVRTGELAMPGAPVLMLGDTGYMWVETTDLRETDVTRIEVGMPVEVTFDAVPNRTFAGEIVRIAPMSTVEQGSTNYTVIIEVADLDPGLRWGMTAFVNIDAGGR